MSECVFFIISWKNERDLEFYRERKISWEIKLNYPRRMEFDVVSYRLVLILLNFFFLHIFLCFYDVLERELN